MTPDYLTATATSLYTLEAHVRYLDEVPAGARLEARSAVLGVTGKLLWVWHEMWADDRLRPSTHHAHRIVAVARIGLVIGSRRGNWSGTTAPGAGRGAHRPRR